MVEGFHSTIKFLFINSTMADLVKIIRLVVSVGSDVVYTEGDMSLRTVAQKTQVSTEEDLQLRTLVQK